MDWCIVLLEMPLTRFEECWPLPTESLPEHTWNLNIVTLTLTPWQINSGVLTSLLLPHLLSSITDSLPSLNILCNSKNDAHFMQDGLKHSIRFYGIFPSLKQDFIAYRSSKVSPRPDGIFEIHHLWQSGFCRVHSNSCCSCSFDSEIIKISPSSHKVYSNNILDFQKSTTILNGYATKSGNLFKAPRNNIHLFLLSYLVSSN